MLGAGMVSSGVALPPIPPVTGSRRSPVASWGKPLPYPIIIADRRNNRLLEVTPDKRIVWEFPSPDLGFYRGNEDVNFSPDGRLLAVSEEDNYDIHIVDYDKRALVWTYGAPDVKGSAGPDQLFGSVRAPGRTRDVRQGADRRDPARPAEVGGGGRARRGGRGDEPRGCQHDPALTVQAVYTPAEVADQDVDYLRDLGFPGHYPFTRGIYPSMYRGRLWTMRQYAGFGTAQETNRRFRYMLERGMTGINVAFDLPTQHGYDSDDPRARGEVGKVGVPVSSLRDLEILFDGIPLAEVSPANAINAPGRRDPGDVRGPGRAAGAARSSRLSGSTQNDILKEFIARGTYIFPPRPSLRLVTDVIEYCAEHLPRWNFINVCGYHMREAGSTLVQEVAFALADAVTYVQAAVDRGDCRWTASRRASPSTSPPAPTSSRRPRSSGPRAGCGRGSCASAFGAEQAGELGVPDRRRLGREPAHRPAAREQHRPGDAQRAGRHPGRAPSRCTPRPTTRRSRCRPSNRSSWPCAPSRCWPTRRA